MTQEALKLALEALEDFVDVIKYDNEQDDIGRRACCDVLSYNPHSESCKAKQAITAIKAALAQPAPVQEPEYVYTCNGCDTLYREDDVACDCTVNGLMEFTRHILAPDTTPPAQPPQRKCENCGEFGKCCMEAESQEQNFCPRCGKRTNDIHTCTPPQEKNT
jgi:hypothetical protein